MKFIKLTHIESDSKSPCNSNESRIVGKILIPQEILKNSLILETKELAPPRSFYVQNEITYEHSTSKILLKEFELTNISVAESYQSILDKLDEAKD